MEAHEQMDKLKSVPSLLIYSATQLQTNNMKVESNLKIKFVEKIAALTIKIQVGEIVFVINL